MTKFTWVQTFEKISKWLLQHENNQEYLIQLLKEIGIQKGLEDQDNSGNSFLLQEIDPFSFIALILKHGDEKRNQLIKKLSNFENLNLNVPSDYSGVPNVLPLGAWLFAYAKERKNNDIKTLWQLFRSIYNEEDVEQLFNNALAIKQTAIGKLTQMMFMLFPSKFFPLDSQTENWLIENKILVRKKKNQWNDYKTVIERLNEIFNYSFPELSHRCWFTNTYELNAENLDMLLEIYYKRISDGTDKIKGFINHSKKQLALEISTKKDRTTGENITDLDNFNIILEQKLDTEIPYKWRVVGNSNLSQTNAPNLYGKEVSVFRIKNEVHSWSDVLDILDLYDGYNISKVKKQIETSDREVNIKRNEEKMSSLPLNQILYGPPGTGKTYATTELAVQIAAPDWYTSLTEIDEVVRHQLIKQKYNELIKAKQIAFTTFHQSFSYEDFIEGLKAYIPEGEKNIAYKVEDGIFKRIAIAAMKSQGINQTDIELNQEPTIWKISLGERWETDRRKRYFETNQARIGWSNVGDLRYDLTEKEQKYYDSLKSNTHSTLYDFSTRIKIGDIVLCLKDQKTIQAIGVVKSDYYYDATDEDDYAHVRDVNWIAKNISLNILALNDQTNLTLKTVYELYRMSWSNIIEELKKQNIEIDGVTTSNSTEAQNSNYVLVMDEINRGNISKIFGELITLIEDDKRVGKADSRELTLPYSKEPFSVPLNLYLIGTMNTADKSLTQLDLALRRRFDFKEIGPDIKILEDMEASQHDVDICLMLQKMNQRIQYIKGKDYQIGHSYFMPLCKAMDEEKYLELLQRIFKNKIIPLLQEYFFNNLKYISLVLNDNPDDNNERKIVNDLNLAENLFGYEQPPKVNPLHAVEFNSDCFIDLKRFQQIYY